MARQGIFKTRPQHMLESFADSCTTMSQKITYYSNKPILKLESKIILVFIGFLHAVN